MESDTKPRAVDVTWVPAALYERLASDAEDNEAPGLRRALAERARRKANS